VTKMDMVWVAVANLLRPDTGSRRTVTREQIESEVSRLFRASIAQTMIDKHLVSFEPHQADRQKPGRGGSRNRYLFRTHDGSTPSKVGRFRLYKKADGPYDEADRSGPTHPDRNDIDSEFSALITWYESEYLHKC
jgi:hypothetical protein